MERLRPRVLAFVVAVTGVVAVDRAHAAEPDAATVEEAKRVYAEAHDHFVAGRCNDAMPLLVRANSLVPSPNSGLLIARCLVTQNRPVEAANRYAEVERDALNMVRAGETRYADTAAAAAKEGAGLRALLGTVRIRLKPRAGVALEVDGAPMEIGQTGETALLHVPGQAKVTFVLPASRKDRVVPVTAGKESLVTYETEESRPAPSGPAVPWPAWATGGVAVAGLLSFGVFGLASESTYSDLKTRCSPNCGTTADRSDRDRGHTFQTVANVSLITGLVFAAATGVILLTR